MGSPDRLLHEFGQRSLSDDQAVIDYHNPIAPHLDFIQLMHRQQQSRPLSG